MRPPRADRRRSALNSFSNPGFRGAVAPLLRLEAGFKGANGIFIDYMSRNARSKHPMPASKPVQNRGPQTLVNPRASFLKRMRWLLADQASRRRWGWPRGSCECSPNAKCRQKMAQQVSKGEAGWSYRILPVRVGAALVSGRQEDAPELQGRSFAPFLREGLRQGCFRPKSAVLGSSLGNGYQKGTGTRGRQRRRRRRDVPSIFFTVPRVALKGAWPALASMAASTSEACPAAASALWKRHWNVRVRAGQRWRHPAEGDPHAGGRRRTAPGLGDDREGPKTT